MKKIINPKTLTFKILKYLDDKKGLKPRAIANHTGLKYSPLRSIKARGSGGTMEMVESLMKYYPEIIKEFDLEAKEKSEPELEKRVKQLETDNRFLKEMMIKMLEDRGDKDKAEEIKKLI